MPVRAALLGLALIGCTASAAPIASAIPPVQSAAPKTPAAAATSRPPDFTREAIPIRLVSVDADEEVATLAREIGPAWKTATRNASEVRIDPAAAVVIEVRNEVGTSTLVGPPPRVVLYTRQPNGGNLTYALMHELGHLLGCCQPSGHFAGEPRGLMTEPFRCDCPFTDRELRAMSLLR